jgi:hypothetical protein
MNGTKILMCNLLKGTGLSSLTFFGSNGSTGLRIGKRWGESSSLRGNDLI